jgi:chromosome segregation protein
MRLSRLELFGFKSFANRTVFTFSEGLTSIVGPNGCGKSNVVDAIVWALGERGTRSLRVKEMGDVIFHGSNGKRPVNVAEVTVEFALAGRELTVKRRIYKDGVNEYYLDGKLCRLKDIQDVFLGTGVGLNSYAIVEQGKIENFIQMKPQDRRVLIEETSGITRFEEKKGDAIARMEEVRANLERVDDIYAEVTTNLTRVEGEWERWKSYKALSDELQGVEKNILVDGYIRLSRKIARVLERQDALDGEVKAKENEIALTKEGMDAKEKEFSLTEGVVRQLEVDLKAKEKDMENRLLEMEYLAEERKRMEAEVVELKARIAGLEGRAEECRNLIETKTAERNTEAANLADEEERVKTVTGSVAGFKDAIEVSEKGVEEQRSALFVTMSHITDLKNRIAGIERAASERDRREERRRVERQSLENKLDGLALRLEALKTSLTREKEELEDLRSREAAMRAERETLVKDLEERRRTVDRLKGEKRVREEFLRQVTPEKGAKKAALTGLKRLVDLARVEEKAEKALEQFLAKEMEYYVVPPGEGLNGIITVAEENFIFFPEKGLFAWREGEVELTIKWVGSIEEALERVGGGEEGIFINDDFLVDSRGLVLREKTGRRIDLRQARQRIRAEKEIKEIEGELEKGTRGLEETRGRLDLSEKALRDARDAREKKDKVIAGIERETLVAETEEKAAGDRLKELEMRADLPEESEEALLESLRNEQAMREREKEAIEEKMAVLRKETEGLRRTHEETQSRWHALMIGVERKKNLLRSLEEEMERLRETIETITTEKAERNRKILELEGARGDRTRKIEGLEGAYADLKEETSRLVTRLEELKLASGLLHGEMEGLRGKVEELRKDLERLRSRHESAEKERVVFAEKIGAIEERLRTIHAVEDLSRMTLPPPGNYDEERERLLKEITQLGEINFRAEKEYLELKERSQFLEQQKADLRDSLDSLKKTIVRIDQLSREIFAETFEIVCGAFKRFTETIFRGGNGYLHYDKDTEGIEIYAQPPGKKVSRMELLSGGEKALISLAFMLSLIDTRPSPFSLLDEIDAPLDDANVASILDIIREIGRKTQVILITHNRITMEFSNTIYGVTMEDEGISKIVSVRL